MAACLAIKRRQDYMCGVCMEVVFEKVDPSERRYGILSNCSHCYCLKCIQKWRNSRMFEREITLSCPECRIMSQFVFPSEDWWDDKEEKQRLIQKQVELMGTEPCLYFQERRRNCPLGSACFYKHNCDDQMEEVQSLEDEDFELSDMMLMLLADDEETDYDEWGLSPEVFDNFEEVEQQATRT